MNDEEKIIYEQMLDEILTLIEHPELHTEQELRQLKQRVQGIKFLLGYEDEK